MEVPRILESEVPLHATGSEWCHINILDRYLKLLSRVAHGNDIFYLRSLRHRRHCQRGPRGGQDVLVHNSVYVTKRIRMEF